MSKVLVDRELLERLEQWVQEDCTALEELQAVLAQPAEVEGVEVVGCLHGYAKAVSSDPVVVSGWLPECVEPLMTVAQHQRILSAVTAERDRLQEEKGVLESQERYREQDRLAAIEEADQLRAEVEGLREAFGECIQSLHDEMLQSYGGQKPNDMHPVTRRNYDRDMAEIAEYAALAAKEA